MCTRCVMDTTAPNIEFDNQGVCNFCTDFDTRCSHIIKEDVETKEVKRSALIKEIKRQGKGKDYDCIVGVSGGVDSSYVLHLVKKEGLRPLAVHMDNNWNSELATNNIKNLVEDLGVDLYTHVINWNEYRDLMQSFFDADVIDVELLYDNAMTAVNYEMATKYGIKYIISGSNTSTEGLSMPEGWNWIKTDARNIKAIAEKNHVKISTFPIISTLDYLFYRVFRRVKWVSFLDLYDYKKDEALSVLELKYGYKRYPYKHYESIFTRFYQGYILPRKFKVDKRKLHLSTLIMSDQMTRAEALELLEESPYPSETGEREDLLYFLKKMKWTGSELSDYLARSPVPHDIYKSEKKLWDLIRDIYKFFK